MINLYSTYIIGTLIAAILALIWSFILDKNKPATTKEFIAKLVARGLLIAVLFVVIMGFLNIAFGLFTGG